MLHTRVHGLFVSGHLGEDGEAQLHLKIALAVEFETRWAL